MSKKISSLSSFSNLPKADVENIYVFGDSLSDRGNWFSMINQLALFTKARLEAPPATPGGLAFSNKFLIVEYFAHHYGISLEPAWELSREFADIPSQVLGRNKEQLISFAATINNKSGEEVSQLHKNIFEKMAQKDNPAMKKASVKSNGVNYAVVEATIANYHNNVIDLLINRFALPNQVDLHLKETEEEKISSEKSLHFMMIGGNDIMNIIGSSASTSSMENQIKMVASIYIDQISKFLGKGAKSIMVSTSPKIGDIPHYYGSDLADTANQLSFLLENEVKNQVKDKFSPSNVKFVSLIEIVNQIIPEWPENKRHLAAIRDIADGYWSLPHFILTDGEFKTEYINNSNEELLNDGAFFYFDRVHGTDAVYQKVFPFYIEAVNDFDFIEKGKN